MRVAAPAYRRAHAGYNFSRRRRADVGNAGDDRDQQDRVAEHADPMQPPQPAHGRRIAGIAGAEFGVPLLQKPARAHITKAATSATTTAEIGRPVRAKVTVPIMAAIRIIKKCALNMPRSNCVTGGMSGFTSRAIHPSLSEPKFWIASLRSQ